MHSGGSTSDLDKASTSVAMLLPTKGLDHHE